MPVYSKPTSIIRETFYDEKDKLLYVEEAIKRGYLITAEKEDHIWNIETEYLGQIIDSIHQYQTAADTVYLSKIEGSSH